MRRYGDYKGPMPGVRKGVLVAMADGRSTMYALNDLQARGTFLIGVGEEVYAGMLIGEHTREEVRCSALVVVVGFGSAHGPALFMPRPVVWLPTFVACS